MNLIIIRTLIEDEVWLLKQGMCADNLNYTLVLIVLHT